MGVGVDALGPCLVPGNAGWYRRVRDDAVALVEDVQVFLDVEGDLQRPAQLASLLRVAAEHRVTHVEAVVVEPGLDVRGQGDAVVGEVVGELEALGADDEGAIEDAVGVAVHLAGAVVVTLQKLGPEGQHRFLEAELGAVDEGDGLAGIVEQSLLPVTGGALARVLVAVVVRVALEDDLAIGIVLYHHERSGADGPPVEGEVALGEARVVEETVDFRRYRREEVHRQPVHELRIATVDGDRVVALIEDLHTLEVEVAQVQPAFPGRVPEFGSQRLHADDVAPDEAHHRRSGLRVGEALDGVGVVLGAHRP